MNYKELNKIREKLLQESISKDETRYQIMGVYHSEKLKIAISTDGHRMYFDKGFYCDAFKNLTVKNNFEICQGQYPSMAEELTKSCNDFESLQVSVPDTLCFKSKTKEGTFCYLEKIDENVYTFKQEKSEKSMLCLNAVFLKELKGHKFILEFKSRKDKVIFRFLNNDTIIHDVGYVVMPIKM